MKEKDFLELAFKLIGVVLLSAMLASVVIHYNSKIVPQKQYITMDWNTPETPECESE